MFYRGNLFKMRCPKVSIITVCYNSERTIRKTIESVLNQTYKHIEYIIIDGASKDSTLEIIKEYKNKFNGLIKCFSEKDNGIYDAMNKGIKLSKGEIIGIINSDDWYEDNTVKEIVNIYEKLDDKFCIITGYLNKCSIDGKRLYCLKKNIADIKKVYKKMPVNHSSTFVSRKVYEKIGYFNSKYKIAADYGFIYRAINEGVNFYYINKLLSNMRIEGISSDPLFYYILAKERYEVRKNYGSLFFAIIYYLFDLLYLSIRKIKKYFWKSKFDKVIK